MFTEASHSFNLIWYPWDTLAKSKDTNPLLGHFIAFCVQREWWGCEDFWGSYLCISSNAQHSAWNSSLAHSVKILAMCKEKSRSKGTWGYMLTAHFWWLRGGACHYMRGWAQIPQFHTSLPSFTQLREVLSFKDDSLYGSHTKALKK